MAKKKPKTESKSEETRKPFEQSLSELQSIVGALEDGSLPLDESIQRFQDGIGLLKECYQVLENAEQQIEILTRAHPNGEIETAPFDASATFDSVNGSNQLDGEQ